MGDQKFTCGRYKNRTFEDIAKNDPDFCEAVLKAPVCNKYFPEEFKLYLSSRRGTASISAKTVTSFVSQWDDKMKAEFEQIVGPLTVIKKEVHPKTTIRSNGNLGIFIRFFLKKCIFNFQNRNAVNHTIELFASIFPFQVKKSVPSVRLEVGDLFDKQFYADVESFVVQHFDDKRDKVDSFIDLFLSNIFNFKKTQFDKTSLQTLKRVVDSTRDAARSSFRKNYINDYRMTIVNDYLKQFPRLNSAGVSRYIRLRRMYNRLCATFELADLGEQPAEHIRMLPEICCDELLSLLEPGFYVQQRTKYMECFLKYFFFFVYAVESEKEHPVFFIDDPLYECLKGYAEYRNSREAPEKLELCTWKMALTYRRTQELDQGNNFQFSVDDENLRNIREYVENFEDLESATVDVVQPTDMLRLGISIVAKDSIFNMYFRWLDKETDLYVNIIRSLMCPIEIKKAYIYNAHNGTEMCVMIPPVKTEVLEFVRRYNQYDPEGPDAQKDFFALSVEVCLREQVDGSRKANFFL